MKLRKLALVPIAAALMGMSFLANAETYSYVFSDQFSGDAFAGGTPGPKPWASLSFSDVSANLSDGVRLVLSLNSNAGFRNVTEFDFNYGTNPISAADNTALGQLGFTYVSGQAAKAPILTEADSFQADGDGKFDIQFNFEPSSGPLIANQFTPGESLTYLITGSGGASFFNNISLTGGGNGTWYAALHAIAPTSTQSGYLGATAPIPEAETYAMLLAGLGLMGFVARRRRQNTAA